MIAQLSTKEEERCLIFEYILRDEIKQRMSTMKHEGLHITRDATNTADV